MALQLLDGAGLWVPSFVPYGNASTGNATYVLDADLEKAVFVCR
jgi:hypothetical protein